MLKSSDSSCDSCNKFSGCLRKSHRELKYGGVGGNLIDMTWQMCTKSINSKEAWHPLSMYFGRPTQFPESGSCNYSQFYLIIKFIHNTSFWKLSWYSLESNSSHSFLDCLPLLTLESRRTGGLFHPPCGCGFFIWRPSYRYSRPSCINYVIDAIMWHALAVISLW